MILIISHYPVKLSDQKPRGNWDITFLTRYATLCVQVINKLIDFVDNITSSEATFLSGLVAAGVVEVEK